MTDNPTIWTQAFWQATAERAVSTAAQAALLALGGGALNVVDLDWLSLAGFAGGGFVLAVLKALAANAITKTGPGLIAAEIPIDSPFIAPAIIAAAEDKEAEPRNMRLRTQPSQPTTAYWWRSRPNFGDLLSPLLLKHFAQVDVTWAPVATADVLCVGSILDTVPDGWKGIVAGAGKLHERTDGAKLRKATVLGVRGPLSAQGIKGNPCLGDPGLLANELVTVDKHYQLGLIPHWSDIELEHRGEFKKFKPHIIRPAGDPLQVIREIGRCRKVVASSLHGIIVADAFGIPRRTEIAKRLASEGGAFKFRDYNASVSVPFEIGLTQEAPRYLVQDAQQRVYDMLTQLGILLQDQTMKTVPTPTHPYVSTACVHQRHDRCQLVCKWCDKPCLCSCHRYVKKT